jgi:Fe-S cluster assembly protein SufD
VAERHPTLSAAFEAALRTQASGWDRGAEVRRAAFDRFEERGFPTTRDEEWRFTNVAPVAAQPWTPAASAVVPAAALDGYTLSGAASAEIVLLNGRAALAGVVWPAGVTARLERPSALPAGTVFADLNTAFAESALVVDIAAGAVIDRPIHLLYVSVAAAAPALVCPRVEIRAGERAQVAVVETFVSLGDGVVLTSPVTVLHVAQGAIVDHVKLQRERAGAFHLATQSAHLDRGGTLASRALTFGGRISRNDISAVLAGEGAECTLDGLYVADGESLVDTHTTIDHAMPHCPSHERYKGILSGRAQAVFNGKIIVRQDAQKTDAKQTNKALLLTDTSRVNTKPQLEIFADDVKCTHGAAIGQLDMDALFYLRARGIPEDDARNLLIHAFAGEVLDGVRHDVVRERATVWMEEKLRLAHAESTRFDGWLPTAAPAEGL